jgi:hypothetical protein
MLLLCGALLSCSEPAPICPALYVIPITVAVIDSASGLHICDATVFIRDGASNRSGTPSVGGTEASCGYELNPFKTGTYTVSASAPGYQRGQVPNVHVDFDSCGIADKTQDVSVTLVRAP